MAQGNYPSDDGSDPTGNFDEVIRRSVLHQTLDFFETMPNGMGQAIKIKLPRS
jgi:hypothetical protein